MSNHTCYSGYNPLGYCIACRDDNGEEMRKRIEENKKNMGKCVKCGERVEKIIMPYGIGLSYPVFCDKCKLKW